MILYFDPGMPLVEIITHGKGNPVDMVKPNGFQDGMNLEIIMEILVKFAAYAMIGLGANFQFDVTFHVMDTEPFAKGHCPEPVLPEDKACGFPSRDFSLFFRCFIGKADPGHCPVKPAAAAGKVFGTVFFFNHTRLHPETLGCGVLF
jgi:hypothetical protein